MMTPREKSPEEILRQHSYAPDELARLLEMDLYVIQSAVWRGELKAECVGHDVLKWLAERG
jgi:hypothetical protein